MDPRRLLPVLTAVACALVVATIAVTLVRPDPSGSGPSAPPADVATPVGVDAASEVLATWDARRSAAWAGGDVAGLQRLYADGSRTGAADVRLLRRYRDRGLRVEGLTTQVLALDVVGRTPRRLVLLVTDRVAGGAAVGGATPVPLPSDRASTRRVVLVREPGEDWVVAEARAQDSAAASTSRTSSSSKS